MLVHVFDDTPHHYNHMCRFFKEQCHIDHEQQFWVKSPKSINNSGVVENDLISTYQDTDDFFIQLSSLHHSAQIIFHGLANIHIIRRLVLQSIAKRCSCVIWGAELYQHGKQKRSIKEHIVQWLHTVLINRIANVITLTPGDADLVKGYLKRDNVQVLPYPLIGFDRPIVRKKTSSTIKILVGNSATKSNEHIIALQKLSHLSSDDIKLIVPLNYPIDDNYINKVIEKGYELFGDKFVPITKMLDKSTYDELLTNIDMVLFLHQRQQGLYVVYSMLSMGKPIFLRNNTSSYDNLKSLGFSVQETETFSDYSFADLTALVKQTNVDNQVLMEQCFSEQALAPKWSSMLNDLF